MKQWYAKELSELTQVSVRTLHHYDNIGLLKPSLRQANGYRLYSEADLARLQQIIALKFFGFKLTEIKKLLTTQGDVQAHFAMQEKFLHDKAKSLMEASTILSRIISESSLEESIPWQKIMTLIEVYHMTQQLENTWIREVLSDDDLRQYAELERTLKTRYSEQEKANFEKDWFELTDQISKNLEQDPNSELGMALGKKCMDLVNQLYGEQHANLRTKIWEDGFKKGKNLDDHGLSLESVTWLDKAIDAYWRDRIYGILTQVGAVAEPEMRLHWDNLMKEMSGDDHPLKNTIHLGVVQDPKISQKAKDWLRKTYGEPHQ